ncbi:hypothetical protein B0T25DRAFT_569715 [Lasiosphaeria hispida]|uniref:Uncharacterized protein n=1 Tax=Lasiosphaeria hispida TaxID=260671 RepID=A0AAJ0HDV7_9PEZI|nr:hypothetical protein B0T25DRAFT_569715 [Lasiosphaeria hispida]
MANIAGKIPPIIAAIFQGLSTPAAGVLAFPIAAAFLLVTTPTLTRLLIVGMFVVVFAIAFHQTAFHHGAPTLEKMPPLVEKIGSILTILCEQISGLVIAALTFPVAATLLIVARATPIKVIILGMFLSLELYLAFHHGAPTLEKTGSIVEKMPPLMEKIGSIVEKMPPLVEKIGSIVEMILWDLGSVVAALAFPVTIMILIVTRDTLTRFIISGMLLGFYYNALRTLEFLKALPKVLKAFFDALKPLLEAPVQHNGILQLLAFLVVIAFIRHFLK